MIGQAPPALYALLLVASVSAWASEPASSLPGPQVGDCVLFREGGAGLVLRAPTYWLKGSVAAIVPERRLAERCPAMGKAIAAYTREDWARVARAIPCVEIDDEVRTVAVLRIKVAVEEWETPWSNQHGTAGWLFRGQFLDQPLKKGELVDMDATWLEHCESRAL